MFLGGNKVDLLLQQRVGIAEKEGVFFLSSTNSEISTDPASRNWRKFNMRVRQILTGIRSCVQARGEALLAK